MTPRRSFSIRGVLVWTSMPSSAGVVQEAGVPLRPSISTRQRRHEPNASRLSVEQSFGIGLSIIAAAAMTEVPGGTLTWRPSMVSVTVAAPVRIGVPVSSSCNSMGLNLLLGRGARPRPHEILAEMIEGAQDRQRRQPAERAERAVRHELAKIAQNLEVLLAVAPGEDPVDHLRAANRADPAGRALAAAFLGAEFEGEARLARHVDRVVEDDDASVPQLALGRNHRLVVERRVEEALREIGAERAANLDGAELAPGARSAAEVLDKLADRGAEGEFDEAALAHVAGELEGLGAARAAHAVIGVGLRAVLQNPRGRGEAKNVVHDRRHAEEARDRRQRRLGAHLPALAFEAVEERGLLAADVGARAEPRLDVEGVVRAENLRPEQARGSRALDGAREHVEGVRIFGADVDVAHGRADRDGGDRHDFDQEERIALHQHAVGEGAAVALVGVANDVSAVGLGGGGGAPFDSGREARPAAPAHHQTIGGLGIAGSPIG